MMDGTDANDALAALERLVHRHKVLTPDQARAAGRLITGNPDYELPAEPAQASGSAPGPDHGPAPRPGPDHAPAPGPDPDPDPDPGPAPDPAPDHAADNASPPGSESL